MSFLLSILVFVWLGLTNQPARPEPVQLIPKMVRWPTHLDHYLCKQLHNGPGVRSYAITNLSGELCKTYCRLIDRINGKVTYTQNVSPNFVRCGPFQARVSLLSNPKTFELGLYCIVVFTVRRRPMCWSQLSRRSWWRPSHRSSWWCTKLRATGHHTATTRRSRRPNARLGRTLQLGQPTTET